MKELLLGSQSLSRQWLLQQSQIPFRIVQQNADERSCSWERPLHELVLCLARLKMASVIMPQDLDQDVQYVLTADTLTQGVNGFLHGKPSSRLDAIETLRNLRDRELTVGTGFCIEKRTYVQGLWKTVALKEGVVIGKCVFSVPYTWIERYLELSPALVCSGSMAIEGYGMQFMRFVSGSYSAIVGLPLYEVREALEDLGFTMH